MRIKKRKKKRERKKKKVRGLEKEKKSELRIEGNEIWNNENKRQEKRMKKKPNEQKRRNEIVDKKERRLVSDELAHTRVRMLQVSWHKTESEIRVKRESTKKKRVEKGKQKNQTW